MGHSNGQAWRKEAFYSTPLGAGAGEHVEELAPLCSTGRDVMVEHAGKYHGGSSKREQ